MYKKVIVLTLAIFLSQVEAKQFLHRGQLFKIQEESMSHSLKRKAKNINLSQKTKDTLLERAKHPKSRSLPRALKTRRFTFDPSITWNDTTKDQEGNVIARKGEKFNPLDTVQLSTSLTFFDATDSKQLDWVQSQPANTKWILTAGNPIALEESLKRPIYFDQQGVYVEKFGIKALPAIVKQGGKRLMIEEVAI